MRFPSTRFSSWRSWQPYTLVTTSFCYRSFLGCKVALISHVQAQYEFLSMGIIILINSVKTEFTRISIQTNQNIYEESQTFPHHTKTWRFKFDKQKICREFGFWILRLDLVSRSRQPDFLVSGFFNKFSFVSALTYETDKEEIVSLNGRVSGGCYK